MDEVVFNILTNTTNLIKNFSGKVKGRKKIITSNLDTSKCGPSIIPYVFHGRLCL